MADGIYLKRFFTSAEDGHILNDNGTKSVEKTLTYLEVFSQNSAAAYVRRVYLFFDLRSIPRNAVFQSASLTVNVTLVNIVAGAKCTVRFGGGLGNTLEIADFNAVTPVAYAPNTATYQSTGVKTLVILPAAIRTLFHDYLAVEFEHDNSTGASNQLRFDSSESGGTTPYIDVSYTLPDESLGLYQGSDVPVI